MVSFHFKTNDITVAIEFDGEKKT